LGSGVAQHAAEHLQGVRAIAQHVQQLGADVAQADERMEQHLREKFAHQLGALAPAVTTVAEPQRPATSSPAATELRALLARPGGIRQLIIANEILRRPGERR
jgi:hypothetical protein